jgi:enolase
MPLLAVSMAAARAGAITYSETSVSLSYIEDLKCPNSIGKYSLPSPLDEYYKWWSACF